MPKPPKKLPDALTDCVILEESYKSGRFRWRDLAMRAQLPKTSKNKRGNL